MNAKNRTKNALRLIGFPPEIDEANRKEAEEKGLSYSALVAQVMARHHHLPVPKIKMGRPKKPKE